MDLLTAERRVWCHVLSQRITCVNVYSRLLDAVVTFYKGYNTTSILDVVDECSLCFAASQGFS